MTPSHSAPKLEGYVAPKLEAAPKIEGYTAPKISRLAFEQPRFSDSFVVDEQSMLAEQREVNRGVRATFTSLNSTLRSQGAAIRGLEELMKRALPEVDRLNKADKTKADFAAVDRVVAEVVRLTEQVNTAEKERGQLASAIDTKFDNGLGRQALDTLARQQQQADQEASAREAVTGEVVRLASSVAGFATTLEAVRAEGKQNEPRIASLERRADSNDASLRTDRDEVSKSLRNKVDLQALDAVVRGVQETGEATDRRLSKIESDARKQQAEALTAIGAAMSRDECQLALSAITEQLARQSNETSQGDARVHDAMTLRIERAEESARAALTQLDNDCADARAELQAQMSKVSLSVETTGANVTQGLKASIASVEKEHADLKQVVERLQGEVMGTTAMQAEHADLRDELERLHTATTTATTTAADAAARAVAAAAATPVTEVREVHHHHAAPTTVAAPAPPPPPSGGVMIGAAAAALKGGAALSGVAQLRATIGQMRTELSALEGAQQKVAAELVDLGELNLGGVAERVGAQQHLLDGMTRQVQRLTERVESVEEQSGAVFAGDGRTNEFGLMQRRLAILEAELAASRQREVEQRDSSVTLMRMVEAMRVTVEGLETRITNEVGAAARSNIETRQAAANAQAAAASAASAARAAALDAVAGPQKTSSMAAAAALDAATSPQRTSPSGRRLSPPFAAALGLDESASRAAAAAEHLARMSSQQAEAAARAAEGLRSELTSMRTEQAASKREMGVIQAEIAGLRHATAANPFLANSYSAAASLSSMPPRSAVGSPNNAPQPTPNTVQAGGGPTLPAHIGGGAKAGGGMSASDTSRLWDLEAAQQATTSAQRAIEESMSAWSATHAETIEALLSHSLTGRWVGIVEAGATRGVATWQHQAANTHSECFFWTANSQSVTTLEAGVYEVGIGLWPPTPGMHAELLVDGRPAALASGSEADGSAAANSHGLPLSTGRSEACGLVCITLLSLHAGAVLTLGVEQATKPTKAYLGLHKL